MDYNVILTEFIVGVIGLVFGFFGGVAWKSKQINKSSIKQKNIKGNARASITNSNKSNLKG